jgi:hypothetical protein
MFWGIGKRGRRNREISTIRNQLLKKEIRSRKTANQEQIG